MHKELPTDTIISHYRIVAKIGAGGILSKIGEGGMREVFRSEFIEFRRRIKHGAN